MAATCSNCAYESQDDFRFCPACGTQQVDDQGDPLIGRTLAGKFRVLEPIGAGSMGRVYLAEHMTLKKRIALKVLRRDVEVADDALKRFQREGIAAGQVSHPGVIQIFDFDRTEDGQFFLAMEYVDGTDLKAWLAEKGPFAPTDAVELARQLLGTLVEAHRHGIIHRDLKPENIMVVVSATGDRTLKVLDFGLSKLVDRPLDGTQQTIPGRVLGTPLYMAPEQWRGEDVDHRADIYAAALILYEMVAGQPPFRGSDITEAMMQTQSKAPPSLVETHTQYPIPLALDDVVLKGLAKKREERFQSAGEMLLALEDVHFDGTRTTRRPRAARTTSPESRSRTPMIAAAVAVVALVGVAGAWAGGLFGSSTGRAATSGSATLVSTKADEALTPDERGYLSLLADARDWLQKRDLDRAMDPIGKAMRSKCVDAEAYYVRALIYRQRADDDTAAADFREALDMFPGYGDAAAGIGWIQLERGDLDEAQSRFEAASTAELSSPDGAAGQGAVLCARGNHQAALELLDPAAAEYPRAATVHYWHGQARLALDDLQGATESFVQSKRSDTSFWRAYAGLGDVYRRKGDPDAALRQYRDALKTSPQTGEVRRKIVELLLEQDKVDEARTEIADALDGRPDDGNLHVLNGVLEHQRGAGDKAITALQKGIARGADDAVRVRALLASLLAQRGDYGLAVAHCEAAAEINEADPTVFSTWGLALFRLGEYGDAIEKLERATELDPKDAFVRYNLGVIYMDYVGNAERALLHLRAYRENGGDDPRVDGWIRKLGG